MEEEERGGERGACLYQPETFDSAEKVTLARKTKAARRSLSFCRSYHSSLSLSLPLSLHPFVAPLQMMLVPSSDTTGNAL